MVSLPLKNAFVTTQEIDLIIHLFFIKDKLGSECLSNLTRQRVIERWPQEVEFRPQ